MSASSKRATSLPVESSWRMVDGDHDSFETTVVPDVEDPFLSSGQPSQGSSNGSLNFRRTSSSNINQPGGSTTSTIHPNLPRANSTNSAISIAASAASITSSVSSSQEDCYSINGSQQDSDLHAFLRKASEDDRVLLRSPFQPSLPSSVRQSPLTNSSNTTIGKHHGTSNNSSLRRLGRTSYRSPEPEFRYPKVDVDPACASAHSAMDEDDNVFSRYRFLRVNMNGSPLPQRPQQQKNKNRMTGLSKYGRPGSNDGSDDFGKSRPAWPLWKLIAVGVAILVPAIGVVAAGLVQLPRMPKAAVQSSYAAAALMPICRLPAVTHWELSLCSWASAAGRHTEYKPSRHPSSDPSTANLLLDASELMDAQVQLGTFARDRVLKSRNRPTTRGGNPEQESPEEEFMFPTAHDSWRIPRDRTKNMRSALQKSRAEAVWAARKASGETADAGQRDALLLLELDTYLEATHQVAIALSKFQTGAAAVAPETLAHSNRGTLIQLKRIGHYETHASRPTTTEASRRKTLREAYRRRTDALLEKATDRVKEAKTVLAQLDTAGLHLDNLQWIVAARKDELVGVAKREEEENQRAPGKGHDEAETNTPQSQSGLFSWLWHVLLGRPILAHQLQTATEKARQAVRQWDDHAEQLRVLRLQQDDAVRRVANALEELKAVHGSLRDLQTRFDRDYILKNKKHNLTEKPGDADVQKHIVVVRTGIERLLNGRR